jgi:protein TonB
MNPSLTKSGLIFLLGFFCFHSFGQGDEQKTSPMSITPDMVYEFVDEPAEFPGGLDSLRRFLSANLNYPENAINKELQGKCYIQFVVTASGEIDHVKVKKGVPKCPECDEEAIRVVKMMPNWRPGKVNNKKVNSYFSLPISFTIYGVKSKD